MKLSFLIVLSLSLHLASSYYDERKPSDYGLDYGSRGAYDRYRGEDLYYGRQRGDDYGRYGGQYDRFNYREREPYLDRYRDQQYRGDYDRDYRPDYYGDYDRGYGYGYDRDYGRNYDRRYGRDRDYGRERDYDRDYDDYDRGYGYDRDYDRDRYNRGYERDNRRDYDDRRPYPGIFYFSRTIIKI